MKRRHLAAGLVVLMGLVFGCSADKQAAAESWMPFNEGMKLAEKTGKPVIIDFYTSWCKWCKVMDRETFSNPEVKKFLDDNFVTIRVNAENRTDKLEFRGRTLTAVELTRSFGVQGYPSLAYLESDGQPIMVIPGFQKPADFMPVLRYIKDGCYKNDVSLEEYKKGGDCGGGA